MQTPDLVNSARAALENFDKLSARCEQLQNEVAEKYSEWCLACDSLKRAEAARREAFLSAINL